jgi:hypothetical protein
LLAHKINIPSHQQHQNPGGLMQVSVIGTQAQPQMLHARLSPSSFGSSNQESSLDFSGDSLATQMQQASVSPNAIIPQVDLGQPLPDATAIPSPENVSTKSHPHGLDTTQTGVDFVLL